MPDSLSSKILVNPENYEEMISKYLEREQAAYQATMEKFGATSKDDLVPLILNAINARFARITGGQPSEEGKTPKPLSERGVIENPQSKSVQEMIDTVLKELNITSEVFSQHFPRQSS